MSIYCMVFYGSDSTSTMAMVYYGRKAWQAMVYSCLLDIVRSSEKPSARRSKTAAKRGLECNLCFKGTTSVLLVMGC